MTIAFFLTGAFPSLSETFILNQITGLLDRGHEVLIHAARPSDPLVPARTHDIVYAHYGWNGLYASMLMDLGFLRGRLVTAFHGADLSWQLGEAGPGVYRGIVLSCARA